MNLFWQVLSLDFGIQIVFGTIALLLNTEKFFDFIGSVTFILCTALAFFYEEKPQLVELKLIHAGCICIWAAKLGSFLLYRVISSGGDSRFDEIKTSPIRFFRVWMIQGIWVYLNLLPSIFVFSAQKEVPELAFVSLIGWAIFAFGLIFETIADYQKTVFRNNPANKGKFITSGLWSISRHPNYFGEILLWYGLFIAAVPFFPSAWARLSVVCPTLTAVLILKLSGVPMLEKSGMERWGKDPKYIAYLANTSCVIPCLGGSGDEKKRM